MSSSFTQYTKTENESIKYLVLQAPFNSIPKTSVNHLGFWYRKTFQIGIDWQIQITSSLIGGCPFRPLSPPSSRPQAVAPRPLWRLPPPAFVASSPPSSRPQAVAPRPLWRLPPPAFVASSPPSSRPKSVAPLPWP